MSIFFDTCMYIMPCHCGDVCNCGPNCACDGDCPCRTKTETLSNEESKVQSDEGGQTI